MPTPVRSRIRSIPASTVLGLPISAVPLSIRPSAVALPPPSNPRRMLIKFFIEPIELADAVAPYFHHSLGTISIGCYDDPSFGGKVKLPELMASRQRRHEQLLRVPTGAVSSKGRVGGAVNNSLAFRADLIIAGIVAVPRGAAAEIIVPGHRIPMLRVFAIDGPP